MTIKKLWWQTLLAVIGLILITCSLCLLLATRLSVRRQTEQAIVPIEAPAIESTPSSWWLSLGAI